jgi:hypothetical protein
MSGGFRPGGTADSSQARSAWNATQRVPRPLWLLFYCPGGAEEFSPGFQPWETSNKAVRPERARDGVGEMPFESSNATEKELGIC